MITAKELRALMPNKVINLQFEVQGILKSAAEQGERQVTLDFRRYGYDWKDIEFLQNAGYVVTRNSACLWWEVSW